MTLPKAASKSVYETYHAIVNRVQAINKSYQNRSDHLVLSDLREGKAVIVSRPFKGLGQDWEKGEEFTCNLMDVQAIAHILGNLGRVLVTKQEQADREEWSRLKPVAETLQPMIEAAAKYQDQAAQAKGAKQQAEQAVKHWAGELEAAESNLKTTERKAAEYIAGLNLEI